VAKKDKPGHLDTLIGANTLVEGNLEAEGGVRVETFVYDMARLAPGHTLSGPAIVESESTTVLIQSDWTLGVDEYGNCVIEEADKA